MHSKQLALMSSVGKINIIFEHDDFLLIEKPSGLACHGPDQENLASILLHNHITPLLCHRLDKESSGLMLIAKSSEAADIFRQLFETHQIEKYYFALCEKKGKKKQGTVKGDIEKSRNGSRKLSTATTATTITQFFSFALPVGEMPSRAFIVKIHGGKTHQIRVVLKSNSSPILGDQRYGGHTFSRLCLHAYALRFRFKGEAFCFVSEIDFLNTKLRDIDEIFHLTSTPWELKWPKI